MRPGSRIHLFEAQVARRVRTSAPHHIFSLASQAQPVHSLASPTPLTDCSRLQAWTCTLRYLKVLNKTHPPPIALRDSQVALSPSSLDALAGRTRDCRYPSNLQIPTTVLSPGCQSSGSRPKPPSWASSSASSCSVRATSPSGPVPPLSSLSLIRSSRLQVIQGPPHTPLW